MPEASVAVGLSISTIRRLIQSGRLPARYERGEKGQNRYFIARVDLATLAAIGGGPAPIARGPERHERHGDHGAHDAPRTGEGSAARPAEAAPHERHDPHEALPPGPHERHDFHGAPAPGVPGDHEFQRAGAHGRQEPHETPAASVRGDHGDLAAGAGGLHGVHAAAIGEGEGSLGDQAARLELAVVRERLAGAQEAARLHAERVRGQSRDISFLQAQLDRSREAEEQLRVLLARLTAALPAAPERPALAAVNITPREQEAPRGEGGAPPEASRRLRWWPFGRR